MLEGENIVCLAKDFGEDPTSNHHVMRLLARKNRVLWLNSIATRTPRLSSRRDLGKMARKVGAFARGPVKVDDGLWVFTPLVLPMPHASAAAAINRRIMGATLAWLLRRLGMRGYQLWTFLPTAVPYLGLPGERLAVYYCTDEWSGFSTVDGRRIGAMEQALCGRVDLVFATAETLWQRRRALNPHTVLARHGVDHEHFARALAADTPLPPELGECPRPIVGFMGLVHDWIDVGLLAHLAERRPGWTLALVGKVAVDVSALGRLPNVRLLGPRRYDELPRYCKAFSVGLVPFVMNALTKAANPIKMREYLSAGLPVVSTDLPEAREHAEHCRIARTPQEFLDACDEAIALDTPELRRARSQAMAGFTWTAKVAQISQEVRQAQVRRAALRDVSPAA